MRERKPDTGDSPDIRFGKVLCKQCFVDVFVQFFKYVENYAFYTGIFY